MSIEIRVPDEQEGTSAVVRAWYKRVGDRVAIDEPVVELETDKVTLEVASPVAGVLSAICIESDGEAVPGALLGRIEEETSVRPEPVRVEEVARRPSTSLGTNGVGEERGDREERLSPSVRRALADHGIDPATLSGTGRGGRIRREDVDKAVALAGDRHPDGGDIRHDPMRLRIAGNLVRAVSEAPHVTAMFEADFSAIAAHKNALAEKGTKLSYTAYLVKAAGEAMAVAPAINGRWEADRIAVSPTIDIGVGTALGDKGLVVPVVRDVASLTLEQVGATLDDLVARARAGKLGAGDVAGGSFTISNHGVSGSLFAAPIILHSGQAAILGIGKLDKRVVVREVDGQDRMVIRPMAYVSLTIDHRVVDGHQTNAWLSRFVEIVESWPDA